LFGYIPGTAKAILAGDVDCCWVFMYALLELPAADLLVYGRVGVFAETGGRESVSQKAARCTGAFRDAGQGQTDRVRAMGW
jgi:hypothetical protein